MTTTNKSLADALTIRNLIANDAYAMSFQTMRQYRTALLAACNTRLDQPAEVPAHKPSCASLNLLLLSSPPKPAPCDCGAAAAANGDDCGVRND